MDRACGKEGQEIAINTKGSIKMIKNGDMASFLGQTETSIKATILEI